MSTFKKLITLENEASEFGFRWSKPHQIMEQIKNECDEIQFHFNDANKTKLQEEIGDLLHAACSLCVFYNLDPEETLRLSVDKFARRFEAVKQVTHEAGLKTLNQHTFEELMQFWNKAKERVG